MTVSPPNPYRDFFSCWICIGRQFCILICILLNTNLDTSENCHPAGVSVRIFACSIMIEKCSYVDGSDPEYVLVPLDQDGAGAVDQAPLHHALLHLHHPTLLPHTHTLLLQQGHIVSSAFNDWMSNEQQTKI